MKTGMLWFAGKGKKTAEQVEQAAGYYEKKYGSTPDLCFENPGEFDQAGPEGIRVEADRGVPKGHLFLGKKE